MLNILQIHITYIHHGCNESIDGTHYILHIVYYLHIL